MVYVPLEFAPTRKPLMPVLMPIPPFERLIRNSPIFFDLRKEKAIAMRGNIIERP